MASLATLAAVQPVAVKGLGGSSLAGTKLPLRPSRQTLTPKNFKYQNQSPKMLLLLVWNCMKLVGGFLFSGLVLWWLSMVTKAFTLI